MIIAAASILLSFIFLYFFVRYLTLRTKVGEDHEILDSILSRVKDGIIMSDASGKVILVNSIVSTILDMNTNALIGLSLNELQKLIQEKVFENIDSTEVLPIESDNSEYWCSNSSEITLNNKKYGAASRITILHNLSECSTAHRIIHRMAHNDSLTGLSNRAHIKELLASVIKAAENKKTKFAVSFIDLDNFKVINDTMGHDVGDRVLKHVSSVIRGCLGSKTYAGRLGGDEFIVILPDINTSLDAVINIKALIKEFSKPINFADKEINISASVGISVYPLHGSDSETLLKNADIAMYNAKSKGKNVCLLYRKEMNFEYLKKYETINDLKKALSNNEFKLFYQPKVDITSNKIVGLEALLRWFHPEKGIISPIDFVPLAEETGLIHPLGEWVLKEACRQNKMWQESGYTPLKVAVNLSAKQVEHQNLIIMVRKVLEETELDPRWLEFEVTENIAVTCFECALNQLTQLKNMGATIAIDDFGNGYSSFNYLRMLPIDTFKIDKIFLDNLMSHPNEKLITASMIELGKSLNLSVVAEGVEYNEQVSFLKEHQCNIVQGYLFAKPGPAEEIEKLLSKKKP